MPLWFWLNIPACILFFLAIAGVPLWLVLTRPDQVPVADHRQGPVERVRPRIAVPLGN